MTKIQGGIIAAITIALSVPLALQHRTARTLEEENRALRAELRQVELLSAENQRLSNLLAQAQKPVLPTKNDQSREVLRLRGEVGALRKTAEEAAAVAAKATESPLSGVTANPEMSKVIRDQQKMGMSLIYKEFSKQANLPNETADALNNLLADNVMTNINHITAILRDGKPAEERDRILGQQEMEMNAKVKELLGPDGYQKYQEYNRTIASHLTAEQFKLMLPGDKEKKENQSKQLYDLMLEETRKVLTSRGLTEDYQTVPTLNFRNFVSEGEAEKSLELLDSIYEQVHTSAGSFLNAEELAKFAEFRKLAINHNRVGLALNRKLMAPPTK